MHEDAIGQSSWISFNSSSRSQGRRRNSWFDCFTEPAERLEQAAFDQNQTAALDQLSMIRRFLSAWKRRD